MKDGLSKIIVAVVLTLFAIGGGYLYFTKTAPERAYKAEIYKLKLVREHQALELEATKQRIELDAIKKEIDRKTPTMRLVPDDANKG
jgi:hypothetical protein